MMRPYLCVAANCLMPRPQLSAGDYRQICIAAAYQACPPARWTVFVLLLGGVIVVHVLDWFDYASSTSAVSQAIFDRALAPWYPQAVIEPGAVVLFRRENSDVNVDEAPAAPSLPGSEWPPTYTDQRNVIQTILLHCPAAVLIDIGYDSRRAQQISFETFLATLLHTRRHSGCRGVPPILVFAEDVDERNPEFRALDQLAQGDWSVRRTKKLMKDVANVDATTLMPMPAVDDTIETHVARALVSWPSRNQRGGRDDGLSSLDYYFLRGFEFKNINSKAGTPGNDTGRASLALAGYLAFCHAGGSCALRLESPNRTTASDEASISATLRPTIYELAQQFYVSGRSVEPIPQLMRRAAARNSEALSAGGVVTDVAFHRPLDVRWRRWSPPANAALITYKDDKPGMASQDGPTRRLCHGPLPEELCALAPAQCRNVAEALRTVLTALAGYDPEAVELAQAQCYPLPVVTSQQLNIASITWALQAQSARSGHQANRVAATLPLLENINRTLKGKIVFVGVEDRTSNDVFDSPVHGTLPGVFFHAMAFDNLARWHQNYFFAPKNVTHIDISSKISVGINNVIIINILLIIFISFLFIFIFNFFDKILGIQAFWQNCWNKMRSDFPPSVLFSMSVILLSGITFVSSRALIIILALAGSAVTSASLVILINLPPADWLGVVPLGIIPALAISTTGLQPPDGDPYSV